jgi:hypothetical protein
MTSHVLTVQALKEHAVYIGAETWMDVSAAMIQIRIREIIICAKDLENHKALNSIILVTCLRSKKMMDSFPK